MRLHLGEMHEFHFPSGHDSHWLEYAELTSHLPDENNKLYFKVPPVHYGSSIVAYAHIFAVTDNEAVYHKTAAGLQIDIKDSAMDYPFKKFPHMLSWKKTLDKEESAL